MKTKYSIYGILVDNLSRQLTDSINELDRQIKEQAERERNDPPNRVRLEHPGIIWKPFVKQVWIKGEEFPLTEISCGWSANLSDEQVAALPDDAPRGKFSLLVSSNDLDDLIKDLQKMKKGTEG